MRRSRLLVLFAWTASSFAMAANLASDELRRQPVAQQLAYFSAAIEGCSAVDAYYMGVGENEGYAKDIAFWSVTCADGTDFAISFTPDPTEEALYLECDLFESVAGQGCFEPLKQ